MNKQPTKIFGPNLEEILNSAGFYRKKPWVGLTKGESQKLWFDYCERNWDDTIYAIEAKLKEKNDLRPTKSSRRAR